MFLVTTRNKLKIEIIRRLINMNKMFFSAVLLHIKQYYLSHNSIVQQHFCLKYSFQGVLNQVGKFLKFQRVVGGGVTITP